MELKFEEITGYEPTGELIVTKEESLETAIPEYCPDLTRIVDSVGQIRIREKGQRDGVISLGGSVRVVVLYTSEESAGLRSLALSVPFSCSVEDPRELTHLCADGRLMLLEVKMLGARKLYVRVLPEFRVRGYRRVVRRICTGAEENAGVQIRRGSSELTTLNAVWEREFPFAQELPPQSAQAAPEDLLLDQAYLRLNDVQCFGSKLVVKGEAVLSLLYRAQGQTLCARTETLPFSQILEVEDVPEDAVFDGEAAVTEQEIHPVRTEDGTGFSVTMRLALTVRAYEKKTVDYAEDLYSTQIDVTAERQLLTLPSAAPDQTLRCEAREQLEGGSFYYLTDTDLSAPELRSDGGRGTVSADVRMRVLYLDEAGTPVTAERSAQLTADLRSSAAAARVFAEPAAIQRSGSGCQLLLPVQFRLQSGGGVEITAVTGLQEHGEIDRSQLPSLTLRRMEEGETLWELAKRCHTEEAAIREANGIDAPTASSGMLLIPKGR